MSPRLVRILRNAAVFAVLFWIVLFAAGRLFPGLFTTRIEWWLLPVLFVVRVVPDLIILVVRKAREARKGPEA